MLDWPGCFTWADARERALASVPSAVGGFIDWLLDHGEDAAFVDGSELTVEEEVPADRPTGFERNATFERDQLPVTDRQLNDAVRRLTWAHAELLESADRVLLHEARYGVLPAGHADTGVRARRSDLGERSEVPELRTAEEVLWHVARVQVLLVARLEGDELPDEVAPIDTDPRDYLTTTTAWTLARLPKLHADEPLRRSDELGEAWTLSKVLRRLLAHTLDHLRELEQRLAIATEAAERLEIRRNPPDLSQLARLFAATGFAVRIRDRDRLARMLEGSTETYSAWDGDRLVAFARTLTDGAFNAYVSTVAVHPRWQGRGLGRRLMKVVVGGRDDIKFVLEARTGVEGFYQALEFEPSPTTMSRPRRR
jgi:GNAT superfamily N-acetyltransferase